MKFTLMQIVLNLNAQVLQYQQAPRFELEQLVVIHTSSNDAEHPFRSLNHLDLYQFLETKFHIEIHRLATIHYW